MGFALIVCAAETATATTPNGDEQQIVYRLEAGNGIPGRFRITIGPDRPGTWTVSAAWEGRPLAGLWVEGETGEMITRTVGPSPRVVRIDVSDADLRRKRQWVVRFAPTINRGRLSGSMVVAKPRIAGDVPRGAPVGSKSAAVVEPIDGPGLVLRQAFGEDPAGRALEALARAVAGASAASSKWYVEHGSLLVEKLRQADSPQSARRELDLIWSSLKGRHAPDESLDVAFRNVLATLNDLSRPRRSEQRQMTVDRRREQVVEALARLVDELEE